MCELTASRPAERWRYFEAVFVVMAVCVTNGCGSAGLTEADWFSAVRGTLKGVNGGQGFLLDHGCMGPRSRKCL